MKQIPVVEVKTVAKETIELEIWKSAEGMWHINVDGINTAKSHFESKVRQLVADVKEFNPEYEFVVIG